MNRLRTYLDKILCHLSSLVFERRSGGGRHIVWRGGRYGERYDAPTHPEDAV